ncbi:MAG: glycerophosphodiester phosphodiesterase [Gemmatimonadetes bacterium]|nr:glycerophosphodiester phosphodiesterase [Gemmatimonadota bacterium]
MIRSGWFLAAAGVTVLGTAGLVRDRRRRSRRLRPPLLREPPWLIAHRGGAALAPENTLAAFRRAAEEWRADMIELDVRATADGQCVVLHDVTVDRTTDGTGAIAAMTLAQVRELDAGYRFTPDGGASFPYRGCGVRIPTIEEVLEAVPDTLVVEVKTAAAQRPLFEAIRRSGAAARVIAAGEHESARTLFRTFPGVTSASYRQLKRFYVLHQRYLGFLWAPSAATVHVPETWAGRRIVSRRFIRELHLHRIAVNVWTVNDPADMRRLLQWGVDGIISDRPDLLGQVIAEWRAQKERRRGTIRD